MHFPIRSVQHSRGARGAQLCLIRRCGFPQTQTQTCHAASDGKHIIPAADRIQNGCGTSGGAGIGY